MLSPTTSKINQASVKQDCMIIVDCKDVEPILNELAIYVSDQVAQFQHLKHISLYFRLLKMMNKLTNLKSSRQLRNF